MSIQTEKLVIRSKSLTYTKIPQKTEHLPKMVRRDTLELFAANTRSLQVKKPFFKNLLTVLEKVQFM